MFLEELLARFPDYVVTADPELSRSTLVRGATRMPVRAVDEHADDRRPRRGARRRPESRPALRGPIVELGRGRARVRSARRAVARPTRLRSFPCRSAARQRPRVRVPARRCGAGGRHRRRHQPDPAGRRACARHPPHRLRDRRHRSRVPAAPRRSRARFRPTIGSSRSSRRRGTRWCDTDTRARRFPPNCPGPRRCSSSSSRRARPAHRRRCAARRAASRASANACRSRPTTSCTARCRFSTATRSRRTSCPRSRRARRSRCAGRFSASEFLADLRAVDATYFNTVGRALSYVLADTAGRRRPRPPREVRARAGVVAERRGRRSAPVSASRWSAATARARARSSSRRCATPGPARSGLPAAGPTSPSSIPRPARSARARSSTTNGRLTNAAARDRRDRAARSRPRLRGLLQQRGGDRRTQPQRLVLVGRPRLPRPRRHLLFRGPHRATGSGSTARTSPPRRSNASSAVIPTSPPSPYTACPTRSPATR